MFLGGVVVYLVINSGKRMMRVDKKIINFLNFWFIVCFN